MLPILFQDSKADQRSVPDGVRGDGAGQDLPPTGAAKQVATPTAHAHTNRSWLWVSFCGYWSRVETEMEGGVEEGGTGGHRQAWMNGKAEGRWKEGEQREQETGTWEVTVKTHASHNCHTINTVRHKHRRGVGNRNSERMGGRELGGKEADGRGHRVPTFSRTSDSKISEFQGLKNEHVWQMDYSVYHFS